MAQVTVTIDSKTYRMACEEGQEEHLSDLAGRFDRYVGHLKNQFGEIGDLRITVPGSCPGGADNRSQHLHMERITGRGLSGSGFQPCRPASRGLRLIKVRSTPDLFGIKLRAAICRLELGPA